MNGIKSSWLYKRYSHFAFIHELKIRNHERRSFLNTAKIRFSEGVEHGNLDDYVDALKKHRVTFSEYMYKFEYWRLDEKERDEFISCSEMQAIYRKTVIPDVRNLFFTKSAFLKAFHQFIYRDWILVRESSFDQFKDMVCQYDCIAKPIEGTRGHGIFKISKCAETDERLESLYKECKEYNILLEQCISSHPEIQAFHPESLNTIRVVTISNRDTCVVFGALLRMGAGDSFIDNTHSGGIFASIDIDSGIVDTDGIDSFGNHYSCHPDSGKTIKGFKIPFWDKVIETCRLACRINPNIIYAGWDVCVREDGRIELIEGNHAPDFDGGMQAPKKIGVKKKVQQVIQELAGYDPLELISITSKTYNQYRYFDR